MINLFVKLIRRLLGRKPDECVFHNWVPCQAWFRYGCTKCGVVYQFGKRFGKIGPEGYYIE